MTGLTQKDVSYESARMKLLLRELISPVYSMWSPISIVATYECAEIKERGVSWNRESLNWGYPLSVFELKCGNAPAILNKGYEGESFSGLRKAYSGGGVGECLAMISLARHDKWSASSSR